MAEAPLSRPPAELRPWPLLMRVETAAAFLDLPVSAFRRRVKAGRLPAPYLTDGNAHLWHQDELRRALAPGRDPAHPDDDPYTKAANDLEV